MDSDDEEVMAALMDEEITAIDAAAIGDNEHLSILVSLISMIIEEDRPVHGGLALGRRKSRPR